MEFKQSEVTHVIPYDGGIAIWAKGNKETGYYIKIEEKKKIW